MTRRIDSFFIKSHCTITYCRFQGVFLKPSSKNSRSRKKEKLHTEIHVNTFACSSSSSSLRLWITHQHSVLILLFLHTAPIHDKRTTWAKAPGEEPRGVTSLCARSAHFSVDCCNSVFRIHNNLLVQIHKLFTYVIQIIFSSSKHYKRQTSAPESRNCICVMRAELKRADCGVSVIVPGQTHGRHRSDSKHFRAHYCEASMLISQAKATSQNN